MRTTSFVVDYPIDTRRLAERLTLVRYDVPRLFGYRDDKRKYQRLHTQVRTQIWQPYRFYTHDELGASNYAIYVLYERAVPIRDITIKFLSPSPLPRRVVAFDQMRPFHMVIKLLQAHYFGVRDTPRFSSQGKHFIQAKVSDRQVTCLEIEIKGDIQNNETHGPQTFKVIGHAARFRPVNPDDISAYSVAVDDYFQKLPPKHGQALLTYIPPSEVQGKIETLYRLYRSADHRATLDYHAQRDYRRTRGYLLYHFVSNFLDYLGTFGIGARQQRRAFIAHSYDRQRAKLPPYHLHVCLLDERVNRTSVSLAAYHELLTAAFPAHTFMMIDELKDANRQPMLVLHDTSADDFTPDGIFADREDPYQQLYGQAAYQTWPKQSININPNDGDSAASPDAYLAYSLCALDGDDRFGLRFQVCLDELALKDLILNGKPVFGRLPYLATDIQASGTARGLPLQAYAYLRRQTFDGTSYRTVLHFAGDRAVFLDLRAPDDKATFRALLANFGLDWETDIEEPWRAKYKYRKDDAVDEEERRTPYNFILGPGQVIEIEDCAERVLYEYDEIEARKQAVDRPMPVATFKLGPFYDDLRTQILLSADQLALAQREATSGGTRAEKVRASLAFRARLDAFDAFLDELLAHRQTITFNDLTSGENAMRIAQVFDVQPVNAVRAYLKRLYQRRGMFPSDKAGDVQSYQGIWYDHEGRFMVGSPEQLKFTQPRAHLIRRFHVYCGHEQFNIAQFLDTLAVTFVRPEQYTVYPYFFHLIDMYIETKLRWGEDPKVSMG